MDAPAGSPDGALTRRYGAIISVAAATVGSLYTIGLLRRSYWALAVPLSIVTLGGVAFALWIGRLLMTTPDEAIQP
jgi:hypothetical protein